MTTATKAGGAVLPVVAWLRKNSGGDEITISDSNLRTYQPKSVQDAWGTCPTLQALTTHAPAQATIDELRAEVERLTRENVALKDGQQIDARNYLECDAERERLTRERDEAQESLSELADWLLEWRQKAKSLEHSLKAKQIDVEAVMRMVEVYAKASSELDESFRSRSRAPRMVNRHDLRVHVAFKAAREALRASLLGDGGTAMASQEKPHD